MSRIAYVAGRYVPHGQARVSIDDRGYTFSDGVYEGIAVRHGSMIDLQAHLDRLWRSLAGIDISFPMSRSALVTILNQVIAKNRTRDGFLYVQITRGVAPRDHAYSRALAPVLVVTCKRLDFDAIAQKARTTGISAKTTDDLRWARCDLKTISLLPNILAKQIARDAGAFEAVMVDRDGFVTEGSSTNIWIVTDDGRLKTRSTLDNILAGVTRRSVTDIAQEHDLQIVEKAFSADEAQTANEMFLTSTTAGVMPIVELDGVSIGDGKPGRCGRALVDAYLAHMNAQALLGHKARATK